MTLPCENCSELYDMYEEIEKIFHNITYQDKAVFVYLLEETIYNFYQGRYDRGYQLPWIELLKPQLGEN